MGDPGEPHASGLLVTSLRDRAEGTVTYVKRFCLESYFARALSPNCSIGYIHRKPSVEALRGQKVRPLPLLFARPQTEPDNSLLLCSNQHPVQARWAGFLLLLLLLFFFLEVCINLKEQVCRAKY